MNIPAVCITVISTPQALIEELAVVAQAERGARAKQIQNDAQIQVAEMLAQAARVL